MKISVLSITNRPIFRPFLQWNYDRQTYPDRELIVVEGDGTTGEKRNKALELATGDFVTWFDDDDFQHPEKLSTFAAHIMADEHKQYGVFAWDHGWFLHLSTRMTSKHKAPGFPIPNVACYRRAGLPPFPDRHVGEDTAWAHEVKRTHAAKILEEDLIKPFIHTVWLVHGRNTCANRVYNWKINELETDAWDEETEDQLARLSREMDSEITAKMTLP